MTTKEPVTAMVDVSRMANYYNALDFLRISFKDNNIKIYDNINFVEQVYKIVTGMSLKYGTVEIFLTNETNSDKQINH